jgi:hypothetical protein
MLTRISPKPIFNQPSPHYDSLDSTLASSSSFQRESILSSNNNSTISSSITQDSSSITPSTDVITSSQNESLPTSSDTTLDNISSQVSPTTSNTISNPRLHPGWNASHRYNTRFRKQHIAAITSSPLPTDFNEQTILAFLSSNDIFSSDNNNLSDIAQNYVFTASEKDILHFGEMQRAPDREDFETDMQREVSDLLTSDTLELTPRSSLSPENHPLQPIWSFRRKRAPDWTILKHRSRVCPHGGMQIEGVNFWETHAPVVSWRTVCLTLILSLLSGLKSRQVDYVSAYTQAPLDCELFLNIPPGFVVQDNNLVFTRSSTKCNSTDYVLRIKAPLTLASSFGPTVLLLFMWTTASFSPNQMTSSILLLLLYKANSNLLLKVM